MSEESSSVSILSTDGNFLMYQTWTFEVDWGEEGNTASRFPWLGRIRILITWESRFIY